MNAQDVVRWELFFHWSTPIQKRKCVHTHLCLKKDITGILFVPPFSLPTRYFLSPLPVRPPLPTIFPQSTPRHIARLPARRGAVLMESHLSQNVLVRVLCASFLPHRCSPCIRSDRNIGMPERSPLRAFCIRCTRNACMPEHSSLRLLRHVKENAD